jgi:hypothetical protein
VISLHDLVQGDVVAESGELLDEAVALTVGVAAGEAVPAQVVVVAVVGE